MTEWFGRYGVSSSGAMRALILGLPMCRCDRCGQTAPRHRVFVANDYRDYIPGDWCRECAVAVAKAMAAKDEQARRQGIKHQLDELGVGDNP